MKAQLQSAEVLGAIEQALARHRAFGDSTYIQGQLEACLKHRLEHIASRLPIAGELLDGLTHTNDDFPHHLTGDTVVRCAILHADDSIRHARAEVGTDHQYGLSLADSEKILAATVRHLREGKFGTTLNDGTLRRLGPEPYLGWVWSEEHSQDIFGRSFRYLVKQNYRGLPSTPTDDEIAMLAKGAMLLRDLLPCLAPSALSHAHTIACFPNVGSWKGTASSSQFNLGGTVFISRFLRTPWWVAEHLFHEAVHQKLYDFRHGHLLLELDFGKEDPSRVWSPWNPQDLNKANQWGTQRVLAAFHVYVHVALLALVAEQRATELEETYGPFRGMIESRKALERAHYLGEKLREVCWDQIGPAGRGLIDWLASALEFMNPSPPPKGAYFHLCLDLYEREANEVAAVLRRDESVPSGLPQKLVPLAKDEVESARHVLTAVGAEHELHRFDEAVAQYTDEDLGAKFHEMRSVIATVLMRASPDGYRFTEKKGADDLVKQMVEGASRRLYPVLSGYPRTVADAKQRANELRFPISCQDDVGRLLRVLAAAVPPGGRVLEIGTGVGVGTAWISAGLGDRTDVELVTIEADRRLSDAVQTSPWPAYVRIVTADALEVLGEIGTFNMVFADAAPVKYGQIEPVLRALRPGGFLVIDDLEAGMRTSEAQRAQKDALRQSLLRHPELQAVELDWATGVILATKSL